jgi:flagellin-like protein
MSNRYLKNNTKAKKGISPVIATVILVAVAVVIAAALAGFSSSLFGSYSQNSQVQIRSISMADTGAGSLDMVNKGATAETVQKVSANVAGTTYVYTLVVGDFPTIDANSDNSANPTTFDFSDVLTSPAAMAAGTITSGQTVTITVQTASGQQYTLSTVVQ